MGWRPCVAAAFFALLASCAYLDRPELVQPGPHLVSLTSTECRAVLRDDAPAASFEQAVARSADYLQRVPGERVMNALDRQVTAAELLAVANGLLETSAARADVAQTICERYRLCRVVVPGRLLITGYYQPELAASRRRTEHFRYPLYRTPGDLVDIELGQWCPGCSGRVGQGRVKDGDLVPYYSRAEIDAGVLDGRGYELAWLDDPIEAFFLHVQGSALLRFDDGVQMQVSYASSNGRPYTSIGRVLAEQGKMPTDAISLQSLKEYLRAHPDEGRAVMAANDRYIFFRAVATGPIGSLGVPLTAGRSLAADAAVYPSGGVAFVRVAELTQGTAEQPRGLIRLMTLQDAGAAITGPQRLDVYWGSGPTAEAIAGTMRSSGELFLVLPK